MGIVNALMVIGVITDVVNVIKGLKAGAKSRLNFHSPFIRDQNIFALSGSCGTLSRALRDNVI